MQVVVVVPTVREECIQNFLEAWHDELAMTNIIVIEDNPQRTFRLAGDNVVHYCWEDIDRELSDIAWIIPRRTDCIRSFGYYKAYFECPDMIITLDDDCFPDPETPNFVAQHWHRLSNSTDMAWVSTLEGTKPRGIPYFQQTRQRPVVINHGLWKQIPDFDAPTQLLQTRHTDPFIWSDQTIPIGKYFPMCGMNLAFRPEVVPALYFLLMGRDYEYDRFGDIWAGILIKKICDHLGFAINSGQPAIIHQRASNVWSNLRKEAPGLEINEFFWQAVDQVTLTQSDFRSCYLELAQKLPLEGIYWHQLTKAMMIWADLFTKVETLAVPSNTLSKIV